MDQIPVKQRFPNRYTGGYLASTTIEKLKLQTIAASNGAPRNRNSDQSGISVIAARVCYPKQ